MHSVLHNFLNYLLKVLPATTAQRTQSRSRHGETQGLHREVRESAFIHAVSFPDLVDLDVSLQLIRVGDRSAHRTQTRSLKPLLHRHGYRRPATELIVKVV